MKIKSVSIKDFKGIENKQYTFGDYTIISGDNGLGKTSILDAIMFCLYGKSYDGTKGNYEPQNSNNEIKENYNMEIEVNIIDDSNFNHIFVKNIKGAKIINLSHNGNVYKKLSDFQVVVDGLLGGVEEFYTCVIPQYLLSIDTKIARSTVIELLPNVEKSAVLEEFLTSVPDKSERFLRDINTTTANQIIENAIHEGKVVDEEKKKLSGKIELLDETLKEMGSIDVDLSALETQRDIIKEKINKASEHQQTIVAAMQNKMNIENKIAAIKTEIENISGKYQNELNRHNTMIENLQQQNFKISEEMQELRNKYIENDVPIDTTCGLCGGIVPNEKLGNAREEKQKKLQNIINKGNAKKQELEEITVKLEELRNNLPQDNSELEKQALQEKLIELENELSKIVILEPVDISDEAQKYEQITKTLSNSDNITREKAKLEKMTLEYEQVQKKIIETKLLFNNAVEFVKLEIAHVVKPINELLGEYALKLHNIQKNGSIKDVFSITKNGVDYKGLSYAETQNAGIKLAQSIQKLSNKELPILIDNIESNNAIINHNGQIIACKVTTDKQIKIGEIK